MIRKLNLVDIAIMIFVLALFIGGVVYLIKGATADITTLVVTVTVRDDMIEGIATGDEIFLESGEKLGVVTAISTLEDTVRTHKLLEITLKREGGKSPLKTGEKFTFRTSRVLSEGSVFSVSKAEG